MELKYTVELHLRCEEGYRGKKLVTRLT